jgi:uncharacterized membrane protein
LVRSGCFEYVGWRIAGWLLIQGRITNLPVDLLAAVSSSGLCKVEISLSVTEAGMGKSRFEAFSDGVIAIITIMVLELKVPHGESIEAIAPLIPVFLSYVLSFIYLGSYWNNHHHMLHTCHKVTGPMLWANLHLLFWLSLITFATGWMGENHFAASPSALDGVVLLMAAIPYWILQQLIIASQGRDSLLYVISEAASNNYQGVRPIWDSKRFGGVQPNMGA